MPWNFLLNSRRKTFSVSLSRNDRITIQEYYRVTFNARRQASRLIDCRLNLADLYEKVELT